jgi:hypothetical protein
VGVRAADGQGMSQRKVPSFVTATVARLPPSTSVSARLRILAAFGIDGGRGRGRGRGGSISVFVEQDVHGVLGVSASGGPATVGFGFSLSESASTALSIWYFWR